MRRVMLHGAYTAQECLKAGVLDIIEIQLRPILLGQGRRLFDTFHLTTSTGPGSDARGTRHAPSALRDSTPLTTVVDISDPPAEFSTL